MQYLSNPSFSILSLSPALSYIRPQRAAALIEAMEEALTEEEEEALAEEALIRPCTQPRPGAVANRRRSTTAA